MSDNKTDVLMQLRTATAEAAQLREIKEDVIRKWAAIGKRPKGAALQLVKYYDRLIRKLEKMISDILNTIRMIQDSTQQRILIEYYHNGLLWEDVFYTVGYSWRQGMRIKEEAINKFYELWSIQNDKR